MKATAIARPNIALIKYWGKRDVERNLPAVGSISVTLQSLYTEMSIEFSPDYAADELVVNGMSNRTMLARLAACLDSVAGDGRCRAKIVSESNFPIAAGLASSASSFAAAVVATAAATGQSKDTHQLAQLAGGASGSAARSLFGGFVELRNTTDNIAVTSLRPATEWPLQIVVAITEAGPKSVGSTTAMEISRKSSPFYTSWLERQESDLSAARDAISARDFDKLAEVSEHNCLKMHSVMWTSRPPIVYWNAATMRCLQVVRSLRAAGRGVFFTMDAGPQVKAVCLPEDADAVFDALADAQGVSKVMVSGIGEGATLQA